MLVRSANRERELSIRVSLGAIRARIVQQLLVETMVLALLGGLIGTAVTQFGLKLLTSVIGPLPNWMQLAMDGRVFVAVTVLCMAAGVVAGLVPAVQASRNSSQTHLITSSRTSTEGPRTRRWTRMLLSAELAATLILLAAAGTLVQTLKAGQDIQPGILDPSRLVTMSLDLEGARYSNAERREAFVSRLEEQIAGSPGVQSVAVTSELPLGGGSARQLEIEGRESIARVRPTVTALVVTPAYFKTLGIEVLQGRAFTPRDGAPGDENAIVNQRFAALYFTEGQPIGRRFKLSASRTASVWLTIVGVSRDVPRSWGSERQDPIVYLPYRGEAPTSAFVLMRAAGDLETTAALLRRRLQEMDPDLAPPDLRTFAEVLAQARSGFAVPSTLFGLLGLVALGFSGMSLYGLTAYAVALRRREIGVRIALGARTRQIQWLVVRQVLVSIGIGAAVGAIAVGRAMHSAIPETTGADPITLPAVLGVGLAACLVASAGPTWRATRLDPAMTLRNE